MTEVEIIFQSFKPCYKWMTFNTLYNIKRYKKHIKKGFKPCYKWMTFNTSDSCWRFIQGDNNFRFKPCYKWMTFNTKVTNEKYGFFIEKF